MTEAVGARNMTEASKVAPALWMSLGAQLYTRLGLAPQAITDNDVISIGRLQFRFKLRIQPEKPPEPNSEQKTDLSVD